MLLPATAGASQLRSFTEFHVVNAKTGVDTGFALKPGAPVTVRAFGAVCPLAGSSCPGPDGSPADLATGGFLLAGVPAWGLVARAGSGPWTQVGSGPTQVSGTGDLTFAVNDDAPSDNTGGFVVLFSYDCYPGNDNGDQQHYHCGPPGKT